MSWKLPEFLGWPFYAALEWGQFLSTHQVLRHTACD
jgi:hypothetical protein